MGITIYIKSDQMCELPLTDSNSKDKDYLDIFMQSEARFEAMSTPTAKSNMSFLTIPNASNSTGKLTTRTASADARALSSSGLSVLNDSRRITDFKSTLTDG